MIPRSQREFADAPNLLFCALLALGELPPQLLCLPVLWLVCSDHLRGERNAFCELCVEPVRQRGNRRRVANEHSTLAVRLEDTFREVPGADNRELLVRATNDQHLWVARWQSLRHYV